MSESTIALEPYACRARVPMTFEFLRLMLALPAGHKILDAQPSADGVVFLIEGPLFPSIPTDETPPLLGLSFDIEACPVRPVLANAPVPMSAMEMTAPARVRGVECLNEGGDRLSRFFAGRRWKA